MPKNTKGRDIAEIIPDKCIGCQLCLAECPVNAIQMVDGVAKIDPDKCTGCGKCADVCPANSILFERVRKKQVSAAEQKPLVITDYEGVAVFIEVRDEVAADVSWELVGKPELAGN
jgi:electron transfer flavoprotein alpha subunit